MVIFKHILCFKEEKGTVQIFKVKYVEVFCCISGMVLTNAFGEHSSAVCTAPVY